MQSSYAITVRAPAAADAEHWAALWSSYQDFYEVCVPDDVTRHTWQRILAPDELIGRVAELGGRLVGFSNLVMHEATWSLTPTLYLEDLFVAATDRGKGAGEALLEDAFAVALQRDCSSIYWHTRQDNKEARRLYDRVAKADDFVRYRLDRSMLQPPMEAAVGSGDDD